MSVYVGIDVHRKRSQVAVVAEDGKVQLNKNTVNGTEPILRLIGDLPPGTGNRQTQLPTHVDPSGTAPAACRNPRGHPGWIRRPGAVTR